jgi:hypothetical protein
MNNEPYLAIMNSNSFLQEIKTNIERIRRYVNFFQMFFLNEWIQPDCISQTA